MNIGEGDFETVTLVLIGNAGLIAYVWYCVQHGYIWNRSDRIERRKRPVEFKWHLRLFILFEVIFVSFLFTTGRVPHGADWG